MKKINISSEAIIYDNFSELNIEDQKLIEEANIAKSKSYAPYSKFNVGAALLLENGVVIHGNNQENAAYPSGMCAERVAIWKAGSEYPNMKIKKLAIVASSENTKVDQPVGPCGACRQTLLEYEINQKAPYEVIFMGEIGKIVKTESLVSLLPFSFDSSYL
ncbi:cytidine deaminase [Tenacibaculum sp. ZS6-P6]|uniref:cytidine deaminase n=1 Tax=Tenacibaculum sp. ZS6-P6 TaxID=3447503 RepID=UPI003F9D90CF